MKAKLIVEGKEFPIEILDEELQKLISDKKITGYERVKGERFYYITEDGDVNSYKDTSDCYNSHYRAANYHSSKKIAENNARADKLMRRLRRFAVEHRKTCIDWNDGAQAKFYLCYEHKDKYINVYNSFMSHSYGEIYFNSKEAALKAIEIFKDELIWYFTEYKDSL